MKLKRKIAEFTGKNKGPLFLCVAGMHGNEHAGIKAIELMQMMLEVEPITNPEFEFNGRFVGMVGNVKASKKDVRFLVKDINRQWNYQNLDRIFHTPEKDLDPEDHEVKELWVAVNMEIQAYQPELLVFLDLHTTSAYGGIYSITPEDPESIQVAQAITAPVVRGLLEGVSGTTLHFFNTKNLGVKTISICFESGQHAEALSINRAIAAIVSCMKAVGSVKSSDVENQHDNILSEFSTNLPKVTRVVYHHPITSADEFVMKPGYTNFQPIKKSEHLADDKKGKVLSPMEGRILMPLYQKLGSDGFFIVQDC